MGNDKSLGSALEGILFLHSETGTEGGYWAFQDSNHIQKNVPRDYCKNCGIYIKKQTRPRQTQGITTLDEEARRELELVGKIKRNRGCADGNHEEEIGDAWSYDGLHVLGNGDHLIIYHPDDNRQVWSGLINLKQCDLFTEHASGMWIHADQIGTERDVWAEYFFKEYLAELIPAKNHK